jgi:polygalacturonase
MTKDFDYCVDTCWWKWVKLVQLAVTNVTVQDVTLANSPHWAITFANGADPRTTGVFEGYKVVAQWAYNNDGTKAPGRGRIKNCFIQANDDIFVLNNSGATIEGCTLWQFGNGAAFQLGWFGKSFADINISNIDLIHSETWWGPGDNSGLLNYAKVPAGAEHPNEIRDITFRNIRLEDKTLRLVGLTPQRGQKIRNVRFADIAIESWRHDDGSSERSNYLDGNNGGAIDGITFENVTVGGEAISAKDSAGLGRLRTSGDVSNIVFSTGGGKQRDSERN